MLFIVKKQHEDSVIVRTVIPLNDVDKKLISKETTIEKIKKRHEDSVILGTVIPLNDDELEFNQESQYGNIYKLNDA
ncbi:2311_t:CDS:2 [Entrophospora sp. SA101]|nr:2311_t:CDS:2 [Entrophospora sp. SA101]